jgi:hypothetical protein
MKNYYIKIGLVLIIILSTVSCKKYLETKSVQTLATPSTLGDLEALLNADLINKGTMLTNGSTDEYYYAYTDWQSRTELHKNGYIWDAQLNNYTDWRDQYLAVFYANTVLYNLDFISNNGDVQRWNRIKGGALFYRALAFFRIAQLYAPQYDVNTADVDAGIVLRLKADFNEVSSRSTVKKTYEQILADLNAALELLPDDLPNNVFTKTFPTKAAVYGFGARVNLQMGDYQKALENADKCLGLYNLLLDYNDATKVVPGSSIPFKLNNEEVIFYSNNDASPASNSRAKVDSNLYNSFAANDIRKTAFFSKNTDNSYRFKGSYNEGNVNLFCGVATDEVYLIRAECLARAESANDAMQDLNGLLSKRYLKASFVPLVANNAAEALKHIINERKKELIFREVRWSDLKRLNKEPAFSTVLTRNLNGQLYTLPANDYRYTMLLPIEITNLVDLPQNPR